MKQGHAYLKLNLHAHQIQVLKCDELLGIWLDTGHYQKYPMPSLWSIHVYNSDMAAIQDHRLRGLFYS